MSLDRLGGGGRRCNRLMISGADMSLAAQCVHRKENGRLDKCLPRTV